MVLTMRLSQHRSATPVVTNIAAGGGCSCVSAFKHRVALREPFQPKTIRLCNKSRVCSARCQAASTTLSKAPASQHAASFGDGDIFIIAGAGIAGLAMAAALTKARKALRKYKAHNRCLEPDVLSLLAQVGIPCKVLERDAGPRKGGSAIGLWPNAFRALDALGVAEPLRQAHPLLTRQDTVPEPFAIVHC